MVIVETTVRLKVKGVAILAHLRLMETTLRLRVVVTTLHLKAVAIMLRPCINIRKGVVTITFHTNSAETTPSKVKVKVKAVDNGEEAGEAGAGEEAQITVLADRGVETHVWRWIIPQIRDMCGRRERSFGIW
ncbi:hypothetical protein PtrM4_131340 [Pyrenophora tritici-repentis]|uniref:Uncharacterized protein n=1 Tax=Pyrenophora tritici-repentis TaxID=45151 RepID=A0A834VL89_9PLEO|nr:hypothetical protein PtrM4_131340 [Pyrenophora tritici-repentis]